MKKFILIIAVVVVIGIVAWGIWFFASSKSSNSNVSLSQSASLPPVQSETQGGVLVRVQNITSPQNSEVAKDFLNGIQNADQIALGGTVVASPYALQIWGDNNKGGEALLEYASSTGWTLVSLGGGEWTVLSLIQEGVPVSLAEQLVVGLTDTTSTSLVTSSTIPAGDTITMGTPEGSVVMNNFYKGADYIDQDEQVVVIQQSSTYNIVYNISDSSFVITLFSAPLGATQQDAESAFLSALGISQKNACKLKVHEEVSANVSDQYIGENSPLSFCVGSPVL